MTFISSASRRATSDPMPPAENHDGGAPQGPDPEVGSGPIGRWLVEEDVGSPLAAASIWAKTHSPINSPLMPREQVSFVLEGVERKAVDTGTDGVPPRTRPSRSARLGPPSVRVNTTSPSMSGGISPSRAFDGADPGPLRTWGGSGNSLWLMTTVSVVSDMAPDRTRGDPARNRSTVG